MMSRITKCFECKLMFSFALLGDEFAPLDDDMEIVLCIYKTDGMHKEDIFLCSNECKEKHVRNHNNIESRF